MEINSFKLGRVPIILILYLIGELFGIQYGQSILAVTTNKATHLTIQDLSTLTPNQNLRIAQITANPTWYNCLTREVWSEAKQDWCNNLSKLQNGDYFLPNYGEITLNNGTYENTEQRYRVTLINREGWIDFGDLNGDGTEDAVFLLAVNSGGSGQFTYLTTVLNINGIMQPLRAEFLGDLGFAEALRDRVEVKSVKINSDRVIVDLITQDTDDPLCCPTKEVTRVYNIQPSLVQIDGDTTNKIVLPEPLSQNQISPEDTILFLETTDSAVRIFRNEQEQPVINLYNKRTEALELRSAPITVEQTPEGTAYIYRGEFTVRVIDRDGTQLLEINGEVQN